MLPALYLVIPIILVMGTFIYLRANRKNLLRLDRKSPSFSLVSSSSKVLADEEDVGNFMLGGLGQGLLLL